MTIRQLIAVGLRFFAFQLCLATLQVMGLAVATKRLPLGANGSLLPGVAIVVFMLLIAAFLWIACAPIASVFLSGFTKMEPLRLSSNEVVIAGCVLMGLWWFKEALIPLIDVWLRAMASAAQTGQSAFASISPQDRAVAVANIAQLILSIFFISRPSRIATAAMRTAKQVHETVQEKTQL